MSAKDRNLPLAALDEATDGTPGERSWADDVGGKVGKRPLLVRCENDLGRLPIRGADQPFRNQQQERKDHDIDLPCAITHHGEATEMS